MADQRAEFEVVLQTENAERDLERLQDRAGGGGRGGGGGGGPGGGGGGGGGGPTVIGGGGNMAKLAGAVAGLVAAANLLGRTTQNLQDAAQPTLDRIAQGLSDQFGVSEAGAMGRAEGRALQATRNFAMEGGGRLSDGMVQEFHRMQMMQEGMRGQGELQFERLNQNRFQGEDRGVKGNLGGETGEGILRVLIGPGGVVGLDQGMKYVNR